MNVKAGLIHNNVSILWFLAFPAMTSFTSPEMGSNTITLACNPVTSEKLNSILDFYVVDWGGGAVGVMSSLSRVVDVDKRHESLSVSSCPLVKCSLLSGHCWKNEKFNASLWGCSQCSAVECVSTLWYTHIPTSTASVEGMTQREQDSMIGCQI